MSGYPSLQEDRFVHNRLPPADQWPELLLLPGDVPSRPLNCVDRLLDRHLAAGRGNRTALVSDTSLWTFDELHEYVCRIARVLTHDFGVVSGNRVLLRGANSPLLVALWLAVQKCGAVAVTTMPLLRRVELETILAVAKPVVAVSDAALVDDLRAAASSPGAGTAIVTYNGDGGELARRMSRQPDWFDTFPASGEDVSLIGFTSGTTGLPKATVHFHRDVLAVCDTVAKHIIRSGEEDVFISTSPLAFTFGLGGLVFFPLYAGASSVLNQRYTPETFSEAILKHRATVCFTVPTFYQRMSRTVSRAATRSLRMSVSSGEALPLPVREQWRTATGLEMTEVLGSTEMLHAFAGSTGGAVKPGFIGPAIPGFRITVLDDDGRVLPPGEIGAMAVKGPTGCRYLDDPRQQDYVRRGWNITGDACSTDENGYVAYHTRLDDMIISAGYNISGVEIENVLLDHPDVAECAVIGMPDDERGQVVTAFVVSINGQQNPEGFAHSLQEFVRYRLAAYKYPRTVRLVDSLPRNESGKIQRFRLRNY